VGGWGCRRLRFSGASWGGDHDRGRRWVVTCDSETDGWALSWPLRLPRSRHARAMAKKRALPRPSMIGNVAPIRPFQDFAAATRQQKRPEACLRAIATATSMPVARTAKASTGRAAVVAPRPPWPRGGTPIAQLSPKNFQQARSTAAHREQRQLASRLDRASDDCRENGASWPMRYPAFDLPCPPPAASRADGCRSAWSRGVRLVVR
jgi:hypothetical protein